MFSIAWMWPGMGNGLNSKGVARDGQDNILNSTDVARDGQCFE